VNKLTVFAPMIDSWYVFVGKACTIMGIQVRLITLKDEEQKIDSDAQDCLKWLRLEQSLKIEKISSSELESVCGETLFVIIRGNYVSSERALITRLTKRFTRNVALLRFCSTSIRWQAKQLIKEPVQPFYSMFTEIWTEDANINLLSATLVKPHLFFGAYPHQRCSILIDSWVLLENEIMAGERPCLFSYAGSANYRRDVVANWIESRLDSTKKLFKIGSHSKEHKVVWHYDRPGTQRERSYEAYIKEIESAWFCLCLPGYTGTSNRVLEAVLRGSIPVIPEEVVKFHCLPLLDGMNAVFVKNDNWIEAVKFVAELGVDRRLAMQGEVIELANTQASLSSISRRIVCNIIGA
jgi:hypothetical protein